MSLTKRQEEQIKLQVCEHQRHKKKYKFPIEVVPGVLLHRFVMHPHVVQPMSSRFLAQFLFQNPKLVIDRTVIDVGAGSGILGLVCAILGAQRVVFSDISPYASRNALENIQTNKVGQRCQVLKGDLFEKVETKAELIIFAQPYFPGRPIKGLPVTIGMLDEGQLVHRFFEEAKRHLTGTILMPYLEWVGQVNNPRIQAPQHGYTVERIFSKKVHGLQSGLFSIYQLTLG